MHLSKFIHSERGKYLMSLLLGLGLASLFRMVCKDKNCIVLKAPDSSEINGQIYRFQDKCYKYNTKQTKCDSNKKIVS
jgi:hypothetical protein